MTSLSRLAPGTLSLLALLAGCAQPGAAYVAWDSKSPLPTLTPLTVDGHCTLVVSGTADVNGKAIGRVALGLEEGVAQIDVVLAKPDPQSSSTFHVVVPIEEQHVAVIFIGQPRYPIWERAAGGKTCAQ
jgi:hypothetical protein